MAARRTPAQKAASRRNLEKARKARSKSSSGSLPSTGTAAAAKKRAFAKKAKGASAMNKGAKAALSGKKVKKKLTSDAALAKKYGLPRSRVKNGLVMNEFGMVLN